MQSGTTFVDWVAVVDEGSTGTGGAGGMGGATIGGQSGIGGSGGTEPGSGGSTGGSTACIPVAETCANLGSDDNCNGDSTEIANGIHSGDECDTGLSGPCGTGSTTCDGTALACFAPLPEDELCDGADRDCDGLVDCEDDDCSGTSICTWQVRYVPDASVGEIESVEAWSTETATTGFTWTELVCMMTAGETLCELPRAPGPELQINVNLTLADGTSGHFSCFADAPCEYEIRGAITLLSPEGDETPLTAAWNYNEVNNDHCWSCNAALGSPKSCDSGNQANQCAP
jgi:hypothetical protein